jgi:hypothetical protein
MRSKFIATSLAIALISATNVGSAVADTAKPGQSMTHMKTGAGLLSTLEAAGVVLYVQGGATSAIMGDSIASANGQIVFHIPITGTKTGVAHVGSTVVFFNTTNNKQVELRNPVIDLAKAEISAVIPQVSTTAMTVLKIANAADLKAKVTKDRKAGVRSTKYEGASLTLAPGIAAALVTLLGLPAGALPEAAAFGSADVSLYSKIKKK